MSLEVLRAGVVFLGEMPLSAPGEQQRFVDRVGGEVSRTEVPGFPMEIPGLPEGLIPGPSTTLQIDRERVTINLAEDRSAFDKAYPTPDHDFARLGALVELAMKYTENWTPPRAVGYNVDLVRDCTDAGSAFSLLSERLLHPELSLPAEWHHLGVVTSTIIFGEAQPNIRWQVKLEPRLGDNTSTRLFAAVNLHIDQPGGQFSKAEVQSNLHRALLRGGAFVEGL